MKDNNQNIKDKKNKSFIPREHETNLSILQLNGTIKGALLNFILDTGA